MTRPPASIIILACIALAIGLLEPSIEIAWKCRTGFETSEACTWGKSLLPLGRAIGLLIIAPITFLVLLFLRGAWRMSRWSGRQDMED